MKTNGNLRTAGKEHTGGEQGAKGKKLVPEKKEKNLKRALFQEIEDDEEIDYLSFKQNDDSIEDYYDDDEDEDLYDDEDDEEDNE